ncbi:HAMP domain-containing protein [Ketobacter sp. MCCC 1A13808]|uniref:sensor histidine kinase n=1 Tax=Ketobacter sp. MCCC 1A13808 TaxID=2602738 RepID=UPI0012EC8550|nr:ATP-binding protein [Ketobacter sp. MCCC 1A13808]MVF14051.1 HAMP domain-containing protein [Ketobacter sp. MCCC 1A13808]
MFNRLYVKLSLTLVVLFALIGVAVLALTRSSMDRYSEEVMQRLNASVAMYVTNELQLISKGVANVDALKTLAHHAMVVNPAIEVYLLDPQGTIISHALGDGSLVLGKVDLKPVKQFLAANARFPIAGDDPRNSQRKKVFSAAEVRQGDRLEGYVYVVLEGHKQEQLASSVFSSQVFRLSALALVGCLAFGLVTALLIFARLSRRLQALTDKADHFYQSSLESGNSAVEPVRQPDLHGRKDELERLSRAFDSMQQRIAQQMKQIQESDAMRRELISNISHDLRTPLTSMLGYIETLQLKFPQLDADTRQQYLTITRNHGVRLQRLVADLFELSKLDSNAVQPVLETFSIAELIQDIVQDFRLKAERKQIRLELEGDLQNAQVYADIHLMERVMENLLENALRHTPVQGTIQITIEKQSQPDGVRIMVSDNGSGIAPADLPYIFDRFYHAQNKDQEDLKSTGLGLAIVKRILDLHLSKITVQSNHQSQTEAHSQRSCGTRFTFHLNTHLAQGN